MSKDTGRKFGPFPPLHPITGRLKSIELARAERIDAIQTIPGWQVVDTSVSEYMQHVILQNGRRYLDVQLWRTGQFVEAKLREDIHQYGFVTLDRMEFARVTLDGLVCSCGVVDEDNQPHRDPECPVHLEAA